MAVLFAALLPLATTEAHPPGRHSLSDKELALGARLHSLRQHEPRVWSARATNQVRVSGPRVKHRVRKQARHIQTLARKDGWDKHHRGYRFKVLRRVLFAKGWITAAEQSAIDEAKAAAKAKAVPKAPAASGIVALGRQLQAEGYTVGEHSAFGGVCLCHSSGSAHYSDRALDINAESMPGGEYAALQRLYERLRNMPGITELLWQTAGHYDHLHLAM